MSNSVNSNKYRLSKYPNETIDEYISRRDKMRTFGSADEFTSLEDLTKQINEVEESFFKIQSILQKCSRVSRRKILRRTEQRFCNDD